MAEGDRGIHQRERSGEIKPLETLYNGVRFRSRHEARWAVFFDTLELKWEYEPEGYELPNGQRYLPDFVLEKFGIIEIKPITENGEWPTDCRAFMCGDMLGQKAHIMCGVPGRTEDSCNDDKATYHGFTQGDHNRIWVACLKCDEISIIYGSESNYRNCDCCTPPFTTETTGTITENHPKIVNAHAEAFGYRFVR